MSFQKRHQMFVEKLREAVINDEISKKSKFKIVPCEDIKETDEAQIQVELEAKFDELFGFAGDD